jgi:hypothetical protein
MGTRTGIVLVLCGLVMFGASGCRDMYLADDIDLDFNWSPLEGVGSSLHTPYIVGTSVTIAAEDALNEDDDVEFTLTSSDETVLRIDSQAQGVASCTAVGAGETEITVFDGEGDEIYSRTVTVRVPTRAELYFHGPLILGLDYEEALADSTLRILRGGVGTFLVRYYDGDELLYGNGVLSATSSAEDQGVALYEEQTFLFENREWLQIQALELGTYTVDLFAGDVAVGHGVVEVVDESAVDDFELLAESTAGADDEEVLAVLAQAYDADGNPLYGVEYSWDLDGVDESGYGDLYRYTYDRDASVPLGASRNGVRQEITIQASDGWVSSTNFIGCSTAGPRPGAPALPVVAGGALLLLGLASRRR